MTPEQFCYWLNGFAELCPDERPTAAQWQAIKDHLETVFVKVTPPVGKPSPAVPSMPTLPLPIAEPARPNWGPRPDPFTPTLGGMPTIIC